ncbi:hypothetical protein R5R35_012528 [Gryllus longicercus]|uniref:DUF3105 domain-containing protein n=1 Tax=Gryllus longicercus TaxID=2509291 RepID=A0AAN9VD82_9ORTH
MPRPQQKELLIAAALLLYLGAVCSQSFEVTTPKVETWTGRWLPERPPVEVTTESTDEDDSHGVKMGVASPVCDDARSNLTLDWDFSPVNYTCFSRYRIRPDESVQPILERENIPRFYIAQHKCMDQPISYDTLLPTFGTHRPLWPRYGEYKFVPRQRWLHNLEHGGIVALYHPCANPVEVNRLRQLVSKCLWRHVISPSNFLDPERPLALLAWGWRLTMPAAQSDVIQEFIQQHALKGPEAISRDGQYDLGLLNPAQYVSNPEDDMLCP